jgi:hypothetical protein
MKRKLYCVLPGGITMLFALHVPSVVYWAALAVLVLATLAIFLKQMSLLRKTIAAVMIVAVFTSLMFIFVIGKGIWVKSDGIRCNVGVSVYVPWNTIKHVYLVDDANVSAYSPVLKTIGMTLGDYRVGWFLTHAGLKVFYATDTPREVITVITEKAAYILSPQKKQLFEETIAKYIQLEKAPEQVQKAQ